MIDMNQWMGIGYLTRDPEIKKVPGKNGEISVCNFSIAVSEGKNDGDVSFFDITCWGKVAENVAQYCSRGKRVCVSGRLKQDRWEKEGEKRSKVKINNAMVQFLTPKAKEGEANTEPRGDRREGMDAPPHTENAAPKANADLGWDDR